MPCATLYAYTIVVVKMYKCIHSRYALPVFAGQFFHRRQTPVMEDTVQTLHNVAVDTASLIKSQLAELFVDRFRYIGGLLFDPWPAAAALGQRNGRNHRDAFQVLIS